MEFTLDTKARSYKIQSAILLYGDNETNNVKKFEYASVHDVKNVGSSTAPSLQIMPGSPITKEGLVESLSSVAEEYVVMTDIIPSQVLSFSQLHLLWWVPAGKRPIYFNSSSVGRVSKVVAHPPLVFLVAEGVWKVFALKTNKRPTAQTQLYRAPYFNVYESDAVCVGSAAVPASKAITSLSAWEEAFFKSEFTHINDRHVRRTNDPKSDTAFWKAYLKSSLPKFPTNMLVMEHKKVGELLTTPSDVTK